MEEFLLYKDGAVYYIMDDWVIFRYPNLADFRKHIDSCLELMEKGLASEKTQMDTARMKNIINRIEHIDKL